MHHALFVSVVNDTGRTLHFIVAVLHFFPSSPNPAASLLRGLCMNSHCHVQGRVAQGQLIAFMIMISRQIYRACSEHIFQVLPTLLAWMEKMSLQLLAVTSCLSAGHTFWLIRVERRGWITEAFPVKASVFYVSNCICFAHVQPQKRFLTLCLEHVLKFGGHEWGMTQTGILVFLSFELFTSHKSFIFVSVCRWNHCVYSTHSLPELSVEFFLMLIYIFFFFNGSTHLFEKGWAQMSPTHFINYFHFAVSALCVELDLICICQLRQ